MGTLNYFSKKGEIKMPKIKEHKFIWFSIIVLGVILIGIPAAIYAQDEPVVNGWVGSSDGQVDSNADSDAISSTLGSASGDFVFTPVNPCRIIDTRVAGGPIPSYGSRSFYVHGAVSGQGGNPGGCSSPVGEPRGVLINIVAVESTGAGYLTVWPYNTSMPLAGVLNYNPANKDPISNAFAVKTTYSGSYDISVYARTQTHVVADVMGYFSMPEATPLQSVVLSNTETVTHNTQFGVFSPSCPSGYTLTGGGCEEEFINSERVIMRSQPYISNGNSYWLCKGHNYSITQKVTADVVCAKVPGR